MEPQVHCVCGICSLEKVDFERALRSFSFSEKRTRGKTFDKEITDTQEIAETKMNAPEK